MHQKMNCLGMVISVLCVVGAGGISVKWGTSGGPIVPPTPAPPTPPPQPPFREPAPAWEDQTGDIPNPNPYKAPVLPQLAHFFTTKAPAALVPVPAAVQPAAQPRHRYTHIAYNPKPNPEPVTTTLSPAKAFVNAYAQPTEPAPTQNTQTQQNNQAQNNQEQYRPEPNYQYLEARNENTYNDYQVPELGVRYFPGFGYKYFTPEQDNDPRKYNKPYKYSYHNKHNALESNDIFAERQHQNDLDLSYEKELALRVKKSPAQYYVPRQPFNYYSQQLFYPSGSQRH